jgi:hypothetical protein
MRQMAIVIIGSVLGVALLIAVTRLLFDTRCTPDSPSFTFAGWLIGGCPDNDRP